MLSSQVIITLVSRAVLNTDFHIQPNTKFKVFQQQNLNNDNHLKTKSTL